MTMMNVKANVGRRPNRHCMNLKTDQVTVMTLLNAIPVQLGGAGGRLHPKIVQGSCADDLYQAIVTFQQKNTAMADGIVEPNGPAIIFMNALAKAHLPLNLVGATAGAMLQNTASDIRIESWKQVPKKYLPPTPEEKQKHQWDELKAKLRHDRHKSLFTKTALRFLEEEENKFGKTSGIGCWCRAFGHAFIGEAGKNDWDERYLMDGDPLVFNGEKKVVKVNNYGIDFDPPVLIFGNLTHYIMKKYEIVDISADAVPTSFAIPRGAPTGRTP